MTTPNPERTREVSECPFCGSDKITVEWEPCPPLDENDTNRRWFAECTQCSCQGPFCQKEPEVIPKWNARADKHGDKERVAIDAPGMCLKCSAIYTSPTTGKLMNECWCGGEIISAQGDPHSIMESVAFHASTRERALRAALLEFVRVERSFGHTGQHKPDECADCKRVIQADAALSRGFLNEDKQ